MRLKAHVNVDGDWIPVDNVEFLDISEDLQGFDEMMFKYNGKTYKSRIQHRDNK